MNLEEKELLRRAEELAVRADSRGIYTRTAFLTEGEAALLEGARLPLKPFFYGGHGEAERCVAVFGNPEEWGYEWESDLVILRIAPAMQKFADELTHRDFLGALLNLGIKREFLGDLLIAENVGYLFVLEQMVQFITEELKRVKHTTVKVSTCQALPDGVSVKTEERFVIAASPRVDALISAVWNLSRSEGKRLVEGECVSVRGKLLINPAAELVAGDRVSVRGYGRFYFDGEENKTRSGRGRMRIRIFC